VTDPYSSKSAAHRLSRHRSFSSLQRCRSSVKHQSSFTYQRFAPVYQQFHGSTRSCAQAFYPQPWELESTRPWNDLGFCHFYCPFDTEGRMGWATSGYASSDKDTLTFYLPDRYYMSGADTFETETQCNWHVDSFNRHSSAVGDLPRPNHNILEPVRTPSLWKEMIPRPL
jgi:hypothetical protein